MWIETQGRKNDGIFTALERAKPHVELCYPASRLEAGCSRLNDCKIHAPPRPKNRLSSKTAACPGSASRLLPVTAWLKAVAPS
jgi:hypothetical protein